LSATLDPQAKVDRAHEHIDALERLVAAFSRDAYSVDVQPAFWVEPLPRASGDVILWAEATREPPAVLWGPIIGDIVHGLRSALDQLVWGLSVEFQATLGVTPPPDPIVRGSPWRMIWFPVCLRPAAWDTGAVPQQLWAIDPTLLTVLKELQPFRTGKNTPDREPLAVLQELWNIDKHRHLHLVNATVELHDVLHVQPFPGLPEIEYEVLSKRAPGPIVGKTEIGRASFIRRPGGLVDTNAPQVGMNPRVAIDVTFDQGAPAHGGRVLHTLREIAQTVKAIIATC
jgi:hypothetical protein